MGSHFEQLPSADYPLDRDPPTSVDNSAYSTLAPESGVQGWTFHNFTSSSAPDHGFDAIALSPTFAPTYGSYAASMPLAYHSQGLISGRSSFFLTESTTSQSQHETRHGSESFSPDTAWSLESVVSAATTDNGFSPAGNHLEVPMCPQPATGAGSRHPKRPRRTDERSTVQGKTAGSSSTTKKKRKEKDQSQTEAPAGTSKSKPSKDKTGKQVHTKSNVKALAATPTNATFFTSPADGKNTSASRSRGHSGRNGTVAYPAAGEPPMATQRERNRMAATRCRAKTKAAIEQLELDERSVSDQRDSLATTRDSLRAEVLHYRSLLLQHQDCNCAHIRQYLQKAAELIARTGGQHPIWGKTGEGGEWADYEEPCELGRDIDDNEEYEDDEDDEDDGEYDA